MYLIISLRNIFQPIGDVPALAGDIRRILFAYLFPSSL